MSASSHSQPPVDAGRRSKQIALVLLGTMGVVGGVVVWDAWRRAQPEAPAASEPPAPPVAADRDYQNNDFTPGVGYYHAPYRAWFPFPFNHHDPSRGFFGGGLWQAAPFAAGLLSSRPTGDAVTSALAAQQRRTQEQSARAGTSGFARTSGSTFGGSSFSSPPGAPATPNTRPTATPSKGPSAPSARPASSPAPSTSKPSIQRGGFGSSGKSSGGSSGS
jgi:hypothetical protein